MFELIISRLNDLRNKIMGFCNGDGGQRSVLRMFDHNVEILKKAGKWNDELENKYKCVLKLSNMEKDFGNNICIDADDD